RHSIASAATRSRYRHCYPVGYTAYTKVLRCIEDINRSRQQPELRDKNTAGISRVWRRTRITVCYRTTALYTAATVFNPVLGAVATTSDGALPHGLESTTLTVLSSRIAPGCNKGMSSLLTGQSSPSRTANCR